MRMGRTCLFLVLVFGVLVHAEKKSSKPKWISGDALKRVASLYSDITAFKKLLKPILQTRVPGTSGNAQVREYLEKELRSLNWHIEEDTFYSMTPYGNKSFTNIIATLDPSRPKRFVLTAHYDSKLYKEFEFIGATDSAVPCAILLDIAIQLNCLLTKANAEKTKHITPQIVFFDGEEAFKEWTDTDSIYGARHLAEKWQNTPHPSEAGKTYLDSIETLVLLDLIGSRDIQFKNFFKATEPLYEVLVKQEKVLANSNLLNPVGVSKRYPLFTPTNKKNFGYYGGIQDDHIPFLNKGVPILHLISAPFPHVWHTRDDNADAIDYDVTDNFNTIFRTFVASYLHLDPNHPLCRKKK